MKHIIYIIAILLFSITAAFAQQRQVNVRVDGLSCPFCAYGLEKKFIKIDGVENLKIDVDKGILTFTEKEGETVSEEDIRKAVKQAGFTPREITYTKQPIKDEKDRNTKR